MERMKRNKKQDWTRVLQERLQDAQLPAPDDFTSWAGQEAPAFPGRSPKTQGDRPEHSGHSWPVAWWPWALGSVAVAACAGLLFLRTPDHHSCLNPKVPPVIIESPAAPAVIPAAPTVIPATPPVIPTPSVVIPAPSVVIPAEEPESPEPAIAQKEIPGQARNDYKDSARNDEPTLRNDEPTVRNGGAPVQNDGAAPAVDPATPIVIPAEEPESPGLPLEPETPARRRRPRLSLRVHAASVSSVNTASAIGVPYNGTNQYSDAVTDQIAPEFYFGNVADGGLASSSKENGQLFPAKGQAYGNNLSYFNNSNSNIINPVPVSRAPAIPISFGVSAELSLSRHWSLLAGLDYTQRSGYHVLDNAPQSLTLHYLGIPLEAHYLFWPESRFRVYLGVGVKAEKSFLVTGGEPLKDPFLFSVNAQAGADVRIFPGIRLYFSPVFSGYLTHSAYANTWDSRPQISLRAGLSFDL